MKNRQNHPNDPRTYGAGPAALFSDPPRGGVIGWRPEVPARTFSTLTAILVPVTRVRLFRPFVQATT